MTFLGKRRGLRLLVGLTVLFGVFNSASACSLSVARVQVTPEFKVVVKHSGTPIPGIPIKIFDNRDLTSESSSEPIRMLVTSQDGSAEIKGLKQGTYLIETGGPGGGNAVYAVITEKPAKPSREVALEWPYTLMGTLKVSTLSGRLVNNDPWSPFQSVQLQLWAPGIETPLAVQVTDSLGRFQFDEKRPGIYVVTVQGHSEKSDPGHEIQGRMSVELAPSSPDALASISLRVGMTSCGMEYSTCAVSDTVVATTSRRVKVIYGPGIGSEEPQVTYAKYRLLNDSGAPIAEGSVDRDGIVTLPSEAMGRSTLVVAASMLTTLEQPLNLLAPNDRSPDLVVSMTRLWPDSECTTMTLEKNATP